MDLCENILFGINSRISYTNEGPFFNGMGTVDYVYSNLALSDLNSIIDSHGVSVSRNLFDHLNFLQNNRGIYRITKLCDFIQHIRIGHFNEFIIAYKFENYDTIQFLRVFVDDSFKSIHTTPTHVT